MKGEAVAIPSLQTAAATAGSKHQWHSPAADSSMGRPPLL